MRKSACNKRKLRERARPRNGDISLFQRFLKMGASTADCIWQIAESIPEFQNHQLTMESHRSTRKGLADLATSTRSRAHFCNCALMFRCPPAIRTLLVQGFRPGLMMVTSCQQHVRSISEGVAPT